MVETPQTESTENTGSDESYSEQQQEQPEEDSRPRAVDFETATAALTEVFDIDGQRGETITDLRTTETDEGRQLVATVENSRSTKLRYRLNSAKQTGRRVGSGAAAFAVLASMGYVVFTVRRLLGGDSEDMPEGGSQNDESVGDE